MARALLSGSADLDSVCGVRDCAEIRLFWYTDLEQARKQARAEGKPILSLRLLGRLDEEFSCANSRFFRTVYYRNSTINELLRERFVLHWRSVRPVPKVTIDFGDGNRLERTLTGNSIHYVLDSRGRLVEALGPRTPIVNGCEYSPDLGVSSAHIDNARAAGEAMEHLYALGHSRIGVITGPLASPISRDRLAGAEAIAVRLDRRPARHPGPLREPQPVGPKRGGIDGQAQRMVHPTSPSRAGRLRRARQARRDAPRPVPRAR